MAYTAWLVWQVRASFRAAESSASDLQDAWRAQDAAARDAAADDAVEQAGAAREHTESVWWRVLGNVPIVGDDVSGVAAMSQSLDVIARDAVVPLGDTVDGLDGLVSDGRIDLDTVADLEDPVRRAHRALVVADDDLAGLDSGGLVDALKYPLRPVRRPGARDAHRAGVRRGRGRGHPDHGGGGGPRNYLLIFQNNAEIRATGGMPGLVGPPCTPTTGRSR